MQRGNTVKVYLPGGSFSVVKYDHTTTVQNVADTVLRRLAPAVEDQSNLFALAYRANSDTHWLLPDLLFLQVHQKLAVFLDVKFELLLRLWTLPPRQLRPATVKLAHAQLWHRYLPELAPGLPLDIALRLGSLEMRRLALECGASRPATLITSLGPHRFFPPHLIHSYKRRTLQKAVESELKKISQLDESTCQAVFLAELDLRCHFTQESFACSLGEPWAVPVTLVIGARLGVAYISSEGGQVVTMTTFERLLSARLLIRENRVLLQLDVADAEEQLTLACHSRSQADDLLSLLDGYVRLVAPHRPPIILPGEEEPVPPLPPRPARLRTPRRPETPPYTPPGSPPLERAELRLGERIGAGHFGDVFSGTYRGDAVAVKQCKSEVGAEALSAEAALLRRLQHTHILRLLGSSPGPPALLVSELAPLGQLRDWLKLERNRTVITLSHLLEYSRQLASALEYIHGEGAVHRDVAARNALVFTPLLVKLSDFGLARLQDTYEGRGQLPIKWLPPESISHQVFNRFSDVWMFGVCLWEILSRGERPYSDTRNADMLALLESGARLPMPADCPNHLHNLLLSCWSHEPTSRPSSTQLRVILSRWSTDSRPETTSATFTQPDSFLSLIPEERNSQLVPSEHSPSPPVKPPLDSSLEQATAHLFNSMASLGLQGEDIVPDEPPETLLELTLEVVRAVMRLTASLQSSTSSDLDSAPLSSAVSRLLRRVSSRHNLSGAAGQLQGDMLALTRALEGSQTPLSLDARRSALERAHVIALHSKTLLELASH